MFETLEHLLASRGEQTRAVVWAHNSHIEVSAATATGWRGELNLGQLCRERFVAAERLVAETEAVKPLSAAPPRGAPDTWPFAL